MTEHTTRAPPATTPDTHAHALTQTIEGSHDNTRKIAAPIITKPFLPADMVKAVNPAQTSSAFIRTPVPWLDSDPPLLLAKNGGFFGHDSLHPTRLVHAMALGGTGSGKSRSVISPLLNAMLSYELRAGARNPSMLIVDPKREFEAGVTHTLAKRNELDRLLTVGQCPPIRIFPSDCKQSQSDRLKTLEEFGSPFMNEGDRNNYWHQLAQTLILDLMQLEEAYFNKTGKRLLNEMRAALGLPGAGAEGFWSQMRIVLNLSCTDFDMFKEVEALLLRMCREADIVSATSGIFQQFKGSSSLIEQWSFVVMSAQNNLATWSNADLAQFVDLDILHTDDNKPFTDLQQEMTNGRVILLCPEPTVGHRTAARAIKAKFYEAVFKRPDLQQPVFLVIDEAHTFLTESEATLLDRARAYRCVVVMATQSVSSLCHAMGSGYSATRAVDIILANSPTRFTFRSNDTSTANWLRTQLPPPAGDGPHILDVRPVAQLRPGEAYINLADGSWDRRRAALCDLV